MTYSIQKIADAVGASAAGDLSIVVSGAAEPEGAASDQIAMAMSPKYTDGLERGQAKVAMMWEGADWRSFGLEAAILVPRPRFAMSGLTALMDLGQGLEAGLHQTAVVDPTARIGENVSIGAFTVIGAGVEIGSGCQIGPHVSIGTEARIGKDAVIRDHVSIGARVVVGHRFRAQPGARLGADGFSYVTPEKSGVETARETLGSKGATRAQHWLRIHSLGAVTVGDDVELGANSTVDNGTIRNTQIGDGTKLDNLVHVGHNTRVGRDCLLCGLTGVSGSVDIGNNVVLGGQTGVADNLFIGDGVITGGGTKVLSNVPAGRVMLGYPAIKMDNHVEIYKATRRLPRLMRDIAALRKAVFKPGSND